jgi:hypothetical protein
MSLFIRGDEKYAKHFPVVGVTPNLYTFNNLPGALGPYVNNIQFYDKYTGRLGPSFSPGNMLTQMVDGFRSDPRYSNIYSNQIRTHVYKNDTRNFEVGLIGTEDNIDITKKALDAYFSGTTKKSKTSTLASYVASATSPTVPVGASVVTPGATTTIVPGP